MSTSGHAINESNKWRTQRKSRSKNVKSQLMVASAAGLLVMAGVAHSQGTQAAQQLTPQESAATQATSPGASMEAYGGMPDTRVQSGVKHAKPCRSDPQCNVFFGGS
jgi:hypothetical protein